MTSEQLAWKIRRHAIEMTHLSQGSHIGAILSVADIVSVLYTDILKFEVKNLNWEERDRIILSKGHAGAAIYAALAENEFFSVEELKTHYADGSRLSGHVSHKVPGVDFSTGSLGHGLSAGTGMAYAIKKDRKDSRVFVIIGDGECDEGSVWEAALFANHYRLNNLIVIVDHNHMQSLDFCENTLEIEKLGDKWSAFGWKVIEIDGNKHSELKKAFVLATENSEIVEQTNAKPTIIIANTIKGYGISFMENNILWHYRFPHDGWEYDRAVEELHVVKPGGTEDIYTPDGIKNSATENNDGDIFKDYTISSTWKPSYLSKINATGNLKN